MMNDDLELQRWLTNHRNSIRRGEPENHFDIDTLARHATAQLSAAKSKSVVEHLLVCDDGRCPAFVREQIESAEAAAQLLYPAREDDAGRAHTFQCRDMLWETFQQIADELGTNIDQVLDEAMQAYAQHRGMIESPTGKRSQEEPSMRPPAARAAAPQEAERGMREPAQYAGHAVEMREDPALLRSDEYDPLSDSQAGVTSEAPVPSSYSEEESYALTAPRKKVTLPVNAPAMARPNTTPAPMRPYAPVSDMVRSPQGRPHPTPPPMARAAPLQGPTLSRLTGNAPPPARSAPGPAAGRGGTMPPQQVQQVRRSGRPAMPSDRPTTRAPYDEPPPSSRGQPPPLPRGLPDTAKLAPKGPTGARLAIVYQNQPVEVTRDRWIIGRSKSQADLRVDDSNVSRQHAAIERVNGVWYVVDLGSTNGVWVGGERVARRALVDGDVIEITTHQLRIRLS